MRPQLQRFLHREEEGQFGDCHRTCIAMILDMDRDDVPHFMDNVPANSPADSPECKAAEAAERAWLAELGLVPVYIPYLGEMPLEELVVHLNHTVRGAAVVLGCTSSNGTNHSVVFYEGQIYNPNASSVAGPMVDGMWWITIYARATLPLQDCAAPASVGAQEDNDD